MSCGQFGCTMVFVNAFNCDNAFIDFMHIVASAHYCSDHEFDSIGTLLNMAQIEIIDEFHSECMMQSMLIRGNKIP
ncbi:hypothetical protein T4E_4517 [Trichinella pseudospiralis]|uniref:Uncharacterized protein n=1 Tax=Trichinella pseudospiralis TaxID=6337 RepID=A0A0V0XE04_TRIPS|nr:hypothetical protein T4E_4517 [Trichinella pseudospiralis]